MFSVAFRLDPTLNQKQGHIQVFDVSLFGPTSVRFEFLQVLISQIPTYSGISDGDLLRICQQIETNRQQKGGTCMYGAGELQDIILFFGLHRDSRVVATPELRIRKAMFTKYATISLSKL